MKILSLFIAGLAISFLTLPQAFAFSISFAWGDIKLCNSGRPNRVANPIFVLSDVPEGTEKIRFRMIDRAVPRFNHGGGTVKYNGEDTIAPGAFKYASPCPPDGRHTYEWTATAFGKGGKKLGVAKATKKYP